ncbi:unnamed protein product [Ixodes pacificus]
MAKTTLQKPDCRAVRCLVVEDPVKILKNAGVVAESQLLAKAPTHCRLGSDLRWNGHPPHPSPRLRPATAMDSISRVSRCGNLETASLDAVNTRVGDLFQNKLRFRVTTREPFRCMLKIAVAMQLSEIAGNGFPSSEVSRRSAKKRDEVARPS